MTDRAKIITIYVVVAILSAGVLGTAFWIRTERARTFAAPEFGDIGKKVVDDFGTLEEDLVLTNQNGDTVKLSDLKDKVWVATNFFAQCDQCLKTSSGDLQKLYQEFRDNPDFHIVSITVNPEQDDVAQLKLYAQALNADPKNWWFVRGPEEQVHEYVEKEMKFMKVERNPPDSIRPFSHDLGVQVYDRGWKRVKKRDLHWAALQGKEVHDAFFEEVRSSIKSSLAEQDSQSAGDQPKP